LLFLSKIIPLSEVAVTAATVRPDLSSPGDASETEAEALGLTSVGLVETDGLVLE
jgi:hypothetical protein